MNSAGLPLMTSIRLTCSVRLREMILKIQCALFLPFRNPTATQSTELMTDEPFDTEMLDMLLGVRTKHFPNKLSHAHPGPY